MITSPRNPRVSELRRLHRTRIRRELGETLLEGPAIVEEAIGGGASVLELFATGDDIVATALAARGGLKLTEVSPEVLRVLGDSVNPRGPIGVMAVPPSAPLVAADTVVLWEVADPGNAGTIIRSAAAFGFRVAATSGCVDLWAPKVVRAGAGGHFRTEITTRMQPEIELLTAAGLVPLVATGRGDATGLSRLEATTDPVAVIIGNEAHGAPQGLLTDPAACPVTVPMPGGTESLNASVAAGILLYLRQASRPHS